MRGLMWFKKDLRIGDQPALYHASQQCEEGLLAIYVIDKSMWDANNTAHCQIEFILRSLEKLRDDLSALNINFLVEIVENTMEIPSLLLKTCHAYKISKLFFNRELEINESRRDEAVLKLLKKNQVAVAAYHDQLILPFESIRTKQDNYFKVFTAFKNEWLKKFSQQQVVCWPKPKKQKPISLIVSTILPKKIPGIYSTIDPKLWPAGEKTAKKRLDQFMEKDLFLYDKQRDFPALDATSKLSPYLATGMLSGRQCFIEAFTANRCELASGNKGALTWMSELIWREFYRHILIAVPRVCMNKAYKLETEKLPWSYDKNLLLAWQQGKTGFPLVDAAMRQLNTIGWMHNRLRMVVAMFLSKNLFLDWRLGEEYFSKQLIDCDFASNNGGWQWSASTGTDSVPYFRVFNPTLQSKRFDASGNFIRQYCPELRSCSNKTIHLPQQPIIDYAQSRQTVIAAFKALL